jgi:hypothetical protein
MTCAVNLSVISERVEGDIGDDWQYSLIAELRHPAGGDRAQIDVAKHKLPPGPARVPPGEPQARLVVAACGETASIELHISAAEHDWIFPDTGTNQRSVTIACPGPGEPFTSKTREIAVRVEERPRVLGGAATLILNVRIDAVCR